MVLVRQLPDVVRATDVAALVLANLTAATSKMNAGLIVAQDRGETGPGPPDQHRVRDASPRDPSQGGAEALPGQRRGAGGIDLDLPGQPVGVVGGNGAGKSTLLRIVAGGTAPTSGRVSGRPAVVGYLPGQFPASTRMPVRVYLRHLAAIHGTRRTGTAELLAALGFSGNLDAPVAQLSTGNAQKIGLAQALSCGAALLVLDEPWSNLDTTAATALDEHLTRTADRVAILIADHTSHAARLPRATTMRLRDGVLTPEQPLPAAPSEHTVIELLCPGDPDAALRLLPTVASSWTGPETLTVRVPAHRGDTLITTAIAAGCSILNVHREQTR